MAKKQKKINKKQSQEIIEASFSEHYDKNDSEKHLELLHSIMFFTTQQHIIFPIMLFSGLLFGFFSLYSLWLGNSDIRFNLMAAFIIAVITSLFIKFYAEFKLNKSRKNKR